MQLTYKKAVKEDANLLVNIYNASFYDDYLQYGECPGYGKTKEEMELSIDNCDKYIIINKNIPVGVLSFKKDTIGNYDIGCLCVIPPYQGMGIGTKAFHYMLSICTDWKRITLVTPADKEQNIKFYTEKCGFKVGNKKLYGNVEIVNLYMERPD